MNNSEEIKAYIEDNYQVSIRGFDKVSLDENKIIFSGIDDMLKKYPEIEDSLSTVFYDEKFKDDGLLRGANIHMGKNGLNYETITHELSHVLDKQRSAGSNFDYSKSILMEARKRLGLRSNSRKYEKLAYEIVGYITKNAKLEEEVFAYSLETELVNSSVGNELSRTIKEIVDVYERRTN